MALRALVKSSVICVLLVPRKWSSRCFYCFLCILTDWEWIISAFWNNEKEVVFLTFFRTRNSQHNVKTFESSSNRMRMFSKRKSKKRKSCRELERISISTSRYLLCMWLQKVRLFCYNTGHWSVAILQELSSQDMLITENSGRNTSCCIWNFTIIILVLQNPAKKIHRLCSGTENWTVNLLANFVLTDMFQSWITIWFNA